MLAIAGLIFLMVFIALPTLQRSQRDTQRRNDMARLVTAVTNYQSNNNGKLPAEGSVAAPAVSEKEGAWPTNCTEAAVKTNSACNMIRTYMNASGAEDNEFKDPNGNSYGLKIMTKANYVTNDAKPTTYDRTPIIVTGAVCANDGAGGINDNGGGTNKRDFAVIFMTEGSGVSCTDNL